MKYLVNRETKEHIVYHEEHSLPIKGWDIVKADSEGWIPWNGGECPLPDSCVCEIEIADGERVDRRMAAVFMWSKNIGDGSVMKYRPILTEQSEPAPAAVDVFTRLRTATGHAASIPSIIAEIDALLGPDYQVVRVEKIEATAPQEDMSDWRNWKPGDFLECLETHYDQFTKGALYRMTRSTGGGIIKFDACDNLEPNGWGHTYFKFHSRPTGATK